MKALILVDIQNDFLPGGALAVPNGDAVIPVANERMGGYELVVATQDWHPPDHLSFASQHADKGPGDRIELDGLDQVLWPDHCVQNTPGSDFAAELRMQEIDCVFKKGTDRHIDSYSGFFDNGHRKATGLADFLRQSGVDRVDIAGLATDYCVKFTALDAVELGFETHVILPGIRGVNLQRDDSAQALEEMQTAGVILMD